MATIRCSLIITLADPIEWERHDLNQPFRFDIVQENEMSTAPIAVVPIPVVCPEFKSHFCSVIHWKSCTLRTIDIRMGTTIRLSAEESTTVEALVKQITLAMDRLLEQTKF